VTWNVANTPKQGETLSASTGTWTGAPTSYAYQWRRCDDAGNNCVDINGATSVTYKLNGGDVGHTLVVIVTATNPCGSAIAALTATQVVSRRK
jgi:hypothetical protein